MFYCRIGLVLLLCGSAAAAEKALTKQELKPHLFEYFSTTHVALKEKQEEVLKAYRRGRIDRRLKRPVEVGRVGNQVRYRFNSRKIKENLVLSQAKSLEELNGPVDRIAYSYPSDPPIPFLQFQDLAVGQIGVIPKPKSSEDQTGNSYTVHQVIDGRTALIKWTHACPRYCNDKILLLHIPTEGLVSEAPLNARGIYEVAGTDRVAASETLPRLLLTVLVLKPFDIAPYVPDQEHLSFRTWTDSTGRFSTEARLISFDEETVELEDQHGRRTTVDRSRLSAAGRLFLSHLE